MEQSKKKIRPGIIKGALIGLLFSAFWTFYVLAFFTIENSDLILIYPEILTAVSVFSMFTYLWKKAVGIVPGILVSLSSLS